MTRSAATLALQAVYDANDALGAVEEHVLRFEALRRLRRLEPGYSPELRDRLLRGALQNLKQHMVQGKKSRRHR